MIDAIRYAKELEETGVPRAQAEKTVRIMSEIISIKLATKDEMAREFVAVRQEMTTEFAKVRQEMATEFANVRQEMASEFANVRQEMATEFASVRHEMAIEFAGVRHEFSNVRHEMREMESRIVIKLAAIQITTITLLFGALAGIAKFFH